MAKDLLSADLCHQDNALAGGTLLVIAAAISSVFYLLFYHYAPVFWALNSKVKPELLTPWINSYMWERDGIEVYVLYALMFAVLTCVVGFWAFYRQVKLKKIRLGLLAVLIPSALYYLKLIGFQPPMGQVPGVRAAGGLLLFISAVTALLTWLETFNEKLVVVAVGLLSLPVFFIASNAVYWFDYSYVLTTGLQLMQGAKFSDIFFLYDALLSLIAACWLKLGLDPALFQMLGQATLWGLVFGIYLFARSFFLNKRLAIPLFISLVLLKEYASPWEPTGAFSPTPLRLDLWFVLLILVYARGAAHWSVGVFTGLLVLLHRAFGLIYTAAYIQLIVILFALDFTAKWTAGKTGASLAETAKKHVRINLPNLAILAVCFILNLLFFGMDEGKWGVMIFQQLGLGFLKIGRQSFYWYAPIMLGALFTLLLSKRKFLSAPYFTSGLFLVLLCVGNSLYFFGRSHENNVLSISAPLLLCLFLFLDLAGAKGNGAQRPRWGRLGLAALPYVFMLLVAASYAQNITARSRIQYENLKKWQFIYRPVKPDLSEVKIITRNSKLLYFITGPQSGRTLTDFMEGDFPYYYYGGYKPQGFWSPYQTWLLTKDLTVFLQDLLDKGYYLVANAEYYTAIGMPPGLVFSNSVVTTGGYLIVWK